MVENHSKLEANPGEQSELISIRQPTFELNWAKATV
jgi:hypothetical protein